MNLGGEEENIDDGLVVIVTRRSQTQDDANCDHGFHQIKNIIIGINQKLSESESDY
jgi:hypothetical protein